MENKICTKCLIEKDFTCFHKHKSRKDGYREVCKACRKIETKEYITTNSEVLSEKKKKYYIDNIEKIKTKNKINNKVWYESNKEKKLEYLKNWYKLNPDYNTNYHRNRRNSDILFKIITNVRRRTNLFLKEKNKSINTTELIGIDYISFREYFENLFYDGMSWENYGEWQVDHIIPLSSAKTKEEIYELAKYTNLQPLWRIDNKKKSNKLNWEPQKF